MKKIVVMLAILGSIFMVYDLYLIFNGNVDLNRHWPFLPTLACLFWAVGLWKADKYMDKYTNRPKK